ncbi:hypothetical protein RF11_04655 [Thelohanellus kitauei]|uniref:HTH psq-type domain-containing protein n=1 Tax=Thelohanellus kitauei TaxID=669202 RepID=A0A0C2J8N5_THEKT|nr:hypothetical protein RF11_04655 [Thelohanellus kitauei]
MFRHTAKSLFPSYLHPTNTLPLVAIVCLKREIKTTKHVVLTLKEKLGIIEALNNGSSGSYMSMKYNVGLSTICDIKIKDDIITKFTQRSIPEDGSLECNVIQKT